MYCHQCGAKAYGTYCSRCGAKLITDDKNHEILLQDWTDEIRYDVLLHQTEIRNLILRHSSQSQKRMSADDFLELCDKAIVPLTGISLAKIGMIVQPIYATLGIKTGKLRKEFYTAPAGKVIVAVICSLARHGQAINQIEQGQDGCLLRADLPSDIWSFAGDLLITIERQEQRISVEAITVIKGQLFDWGKSKRVLRELFDDIKGLPV